MDLEKYKKDTVAQMVEMFLELAKGDIKKQTHSRYYRAYVNYVKDSSFGKIPARKSITVMILEINALQSSSMNCWNRCRKYRNSPALFILCGTGLRLGELLALKWSKVDFERRTIKIERTQTEYTDYDTNSKIYEESNIASTFKAFCNNAGVEYKPSHTCRRSYVTNCLDNLTLAMNKWKLCLHNVLKGVDGNIKLVANAEKEHRFDKGA